MKKMRSYRLDEVTFNRITTLSEALDMSQAEVLELCIFHVYNLFHDARQPDGGRLAIHDTETLLRLLREHTNLSESGED